MFLPITRHKFFVIGFLLLSALVSKAQDGPLSVIVNQNGPPSSLKLSELKSIFRGERQRWHNGTKITIALMKTSTPAGKITSRKIYDMSGDELNKYWLALVFQGKAQAPNFFTSPSDLEAFVAQNPGAIGILEPAYVMPDLKVLIIDGMKSF